MLKLDRPLEIIKPKLLTFKQTGKWVQKLEGTRPRLHLSKAEPKLEHKSSDPDYSIFCSLPSSKPSYISLPRLEAKLNSMAIKPRTV